MSKYIFNRMGSDDFEAMIQALLEKERRGLGDLIQFGPGKDGGREATWTQPVSHPKYIRPANEQTDVPKIWIYQVKYHDIGQRGWQIAREATLSDLNKELEKIVNKYKIPCHSYVMITNVPLTGAYGVGTRDQVIERAKNWEKYIPEVMVWDAADISCMLDANEDVRVSHVETILPGDVLRSCFTASRFKQNRRNSAFKAYLLYVTDSEATARAEEAGDDAPLALNRVFIDLTLKLDTNSPHGSVQGLIKKQFTKVTSDPDNASTFLPKNFDETRASFTLFLGEYSANLILGGPGSGKSTLTQYLALYHAALIVKPNLAISLAKRLKLPDRINAKDLGGYCRPRFPIRIELRRYARWLSGLKRKKDAGQMARYIADELINPNTDAELTSEDIFALASTDPILLILDGLDEVANTETRNLILKHAEAFLRRIEAESGDLQLIMSSRPRGYNGEFEGFKPLRWGINELDKANFDHYCDAWLSCRIHNREELRDARERLLRGMQSLAVQKLAKNLLQATVILAIIRGKREIPIERHKLYEKYVEVIFEREKMKWEVVAKHGQELLRLHERTGYELHKKMALDKAEALSAETFRSYVYYALENYSGKDLKGKTLKQVADQIILAATDRLCFLSGQGKDQSEIDFAIQSFREYFAAEYLSNHSLADPNKVFEMLVLRGPYWANVLQFYVARANPAQQFQWVASIDGTGCDYNEVKSLINLVRKRRALFNVLPEFYIPAKNDLKHALSHIYARETRWTWGNQKYAVDILRILLNGNAWQYIWELFECLSYGDYNNLRAELELLAPLIPHNTPEMKSFSQKIEKLLKEESTQKLILQIVINNMFDLDIDISSCPVELINEIFMETSFRRWNRWVVNTENTAPKISMSSERWLEIMLTGNLCLWFKNPLDSIFPKTFNWLKNLGEPEIYINKHITAYSLPYITKHPTDNDMQDILKEINGIGVETQYVKYITAIITSIQNQKDSQADQNARDAEARLKNPPPYTLRYDYLLGPAAAIFPSKSAWLKFKDACSAFLTVPNFWKIFRKKNFLWTALFFDPKDWHTLIEEQFLSTEDVQFLTDSPLYDFLIKYPKSVKLSIQFSSITPHLIPFPLAKFIRAMFRVASTRGPQVLRDPGFLEYVLYSSKSFESIKKSEAQAFLQEAQKYNILPRYWVAAILLCCAESPGLSPWEVLEFWNNKCQINLPFFRFLIMPHGYNLPENWNSLMHALLQSGREDALLLSVWLASHGRPNKRCQKLLAPQLYQAIKKSSENDPQFVLYIQALKNMSPSMEEIALWTDLGVIKLIIKDSVNNISWLCSRLEDSELLRFEKNSIEIYKHLKRIIIEKDKYPSDLSLSALEALLNLDSLHLQPFNDKDWQIDI